MTHLVFLVPWVSRHLLCKCARGLDTSWPSYSQLFWEFSESRDPLCECVRGLDTSWPSDSDDSSWRMTHPVSRISYFGNFRGHEIYCVDVCRVWALVDLRTMMTHRRRWLIGCHVWLFRVFPKSRDLLCGCVQGLGTSWPSDCDDSSEEMTHRVSRTPLCWCEEEGLGSSDLWTLCDSSRGWLIRCHAMSST